MTPAPTYEQARERDGHLINRPVMIRPSVQGITRGVLINILPNVVGVGSVTYLLQCANGNIIRLIDWSISEMTDDMNLPMSDAAIAEAISPEIAQVETKAPKSKRAKKEAAPKAEKPVREPKAPAEKHECLCGCGGLTASRFVPGHDARSKSALRKAEGNPEETAKLNPALVEYARTDPKWHSWFPNL